MAGNPLDDNKRKLAEQLYHSYWNDAFKIAKSILKSKAAAEDCASSSFIKLLDNLDKVDPFPSPRTRGYLIVITRNMAYREYNLQKRFIDDFSTTTDDIINTIPDSSDTENIVLNNISKEQLMKAFSSLPQKDADLLALTYAFDYSIAECAELFGISVEATNCGTHIQVLNTNLPLEKQL